MEATDRSREQIERAPRHPRIRYRLADAAVSGLPDHGAGLAVAAQAVHWFGLGAYYAEVTRVVAPGGAIALVSYGFLRTEPPIDGRLRAFHRDVIAPYWPPQRRHVESGYRRLPFPFRPVRVPEVRMRTEWSLEELLGYIGTWSAVRAFERATGRDALALLREELAPVWGPADRSRPVRWPLAVVAGRV